MRKVILPFSDNELLKKYGSIYPNPMSYPIEENLSRALFHITQENKSKTTVLKTYDKDF